MKKYIWAVFAVVLAEFMPQKAPVINYTDDDPFVFNLDKPSLKIVQFADIHLTYGFDKHDLMTLALIKTITEGVKPDLVVFTGDQTLSLVPRRLYRTLIRHMDTLETPWTFVLGNHDYDYTTKPKLLHAVNNEETNYMYFKNGPNLDDEAAGNFVFNYYYDDEPFYNLYFLDSKDELTRGKKSGLSRYKYLSEAQVNWYDTKAQSDKVNDIYSSVFMHIPLAQYLNVYDEAYKQHTVGSLNESVYPQSKDTGFFDAMKTSNMSQAVFVGHDHRNNFVLTYDDIMLAYGQSSGYNGYGGIKRGARVIEITKDPDEVPVLTTSIVFEDTL